MIETKPPVEVARNKRDTMLALLDRGVVMLHLDPRLEDVQVPEHLSDSPALRLNIAYGFDLAGLDVDDTGVFAVLSFNRRDFPCDLPWEAVFAMTLPEEGHRGVLWPLSVPLELRAHFVANGVSMKWNPVALGPSFDLGENIKTGGPKLALHDGGRVEDTPSDDDPEPPPTPRGHLQLVKD